ncbi:MAG TPA: hypothetical protein VNW92_00450 [Polyangiaceae bacterium]|nr:hypothetical protein [Polyangiaceae bacterium]
MPRFAALTSLILFAMAGACADRSDCEIAQEALDKCDAEHAAATGVASFQRIPLQVTGECSGENACVAACVNATSCATITWVELNGGDDPNGPPTPKDAGVFSNCLQKCADLAHGS